MAAFFQQYKWPGNVRQLKNCLESMVVMACRSSTLALGDLPATLQQPPDGDRLGALPLGGHDLADLEREAICQTLYQSDGNRTHAAHSLGISVRTLQRKLKQWNMTTDAAISHERA